MAERIVVQVDESLESFVPKYLEDIGRWVEDILDAVGKADFKTIRELSHKMIGTGTGYGFEFITEAGAESNKAANVEDAAGVKEWIGKLKDYLDRIEVEYMEEEDFGFED